MKDWRSSGLQRWAGHSRLMVLACCAAWLFSGSCSVERRGYCHRECVDSESRLCVQRCLARDCPSGLCGDGEGPYAGSADGQVVRPVVESDAQVVACVGDAGCSNPCSDPEFCLECVSDLDCAPPVPFCDAASGLCVGCLADSDCPESQPRCTADAVCVECVANSDCGSGECTAQGSCSGCTTDADCEQGARCDAEQAACIACEVELAPSDTRCPVDDDLAVFVAPSGVAGASGTRAQPLASVAEALLRAAADGKLHIFVCEGIYAETLQIQAEITIHGGFHCPEHVAPWTWDSAVISAIEPSVAVPGPVVTVNGVAGRVALEHLAVHAPDAEVAGGSSVALGAIDVADLRLEQVTLRAGRGQAAAPGTALAAEPSDIGLLSGADAMDVQPGAPGVVLCPGGDISSGGVGGLGGAAPEPGQAGEPAFGEGRGGTVVECQTQNTGGQSGAAGPAGLTGLGATTLGALDEQGWLPAAGFAGQVGSAGQGGGGGAGGQAGGGGGGGAGGCGGAGGLGGPGGGASLALSALRVDLTLADSTLTAADAGAGAAGAPGQPGQEPGWGGGRVGDGCSGGRGGQGGAGGQGGGGAGGVSAAILLRDASVVSERVQLEVGEPGLGGASETPGQAGVNGIAQGIVDLSQ